MFEDWPTLAAVIRRTGISERTLHRKIQAGVVQSLLYYFHNTQGKGDC